MKLDFGCGNSKRNGYIGIDQLALPGVDVVHNLNKVPYPFEDNTFEDIWADNVLEHLSDPLKAVEELWRISKPGAKLHIAVPYFRSRYAFIDPTHRSFFGVSWFDYFNPKHPFHQKYSYSHAKFELENFEFDREQTCPGIFKRIILKIAHAKPAFYEYRLSHLLPLDSLTFHLRTLK